MALFAVSDVHGYFDEMKKALLEAGFFDCKENTTRGIPKKRDAPKG